MEQHKVANFDMASLVKRAQEQNAKRDAIRRQMAEAKLKQKAIHQSNLNVADSLDAAKTGDYVQREDGVSGIVIDHEEELRKMQERDKTGKALMKLGDSSMLVIDANQYDPKEDGVPDGVDPGVIWLEENPDHPDARKVREIKKGFSNFTYGLNGLVDKNSEEARVVAEALEKLRTGEVVLPTPEEYEMQKQAAEERRKAKLRQIAISKAQQRQSGGQSRQQQTVTRQGQQQTPVRKQVSPKINDEPKMAGLPSNAVIKKGAFEQWLKQ